jgi:hypothetical protein
MDISALGGSYGTAASDSLYRAWLEVGPTVDFDPEGRPLTDNQIEFEDLILYAINYAAAGKLSPPPAPATSNELTLRVPAMPAVGELFDVNVHLAGDGAMQGLSLPVSWRDEVVELQGYFAGDLLTAQGGITMLLSPRTGVFDAAVAGRRERGLSGEGELLRLRFKVLAVGNPEFAVGTVTTRSRSNEPVAIKAAVAAAPTVPAVFALRQARPNPFNPVTKIAFDIPRPARVKLVVYDIAGRRVATLVDEEKIPGAYSVPWNGTDQHGAAVASGVYFYRLEAGDFVATRKMMLLK